ncbi:MAG: DUF4270 domain-containing protein [Bacteroidales bacterium]|nr:DUF4270 domain-containing protein [Bacteroidales bacterium]
MKFRLLLQLRHIVFYSMALSLIVFACQKDPSEIGLNIQPPNSVIDAFFTDSISLYGHSELVDSVRTSNTSVSLLGSYYDPIFGTTTANLYTQFLISSSGIDFGENPVLDSLVVFFNYSGFYGDVTTTQTIRVYELSDSDSLSIDSSYYSNQSKPHYETLLAEKTFQPKPYDSVLIDTTNYAPFLRFNISNLTEELGYKFLNADTSNYTSYEKFLKFFHGLYFEAEQVSSSGSIMYFDLNTTFSEMILYYKNDEYDSLGYFFPINEYCSRFHSLNHYNYDNASQEFKDQVLNGDTLLGESSLYLQSLGGVKTKINLPFIDGWKNSGNLYGINEAILIVNNQETYKENYEPPPNLVLLKILEDGTYAFLPGYYNGTEYFGGVYDSINNQYRFRITKYIQDLIGTDELNNGLYMTVSGGSVKANRVKISGYDTSLIDRIKLNVKYTILK